MTLAYAAHILLQNRRKMHAELQTLSDAQLLTVPTGFANNIAWNIGHIIVLQQNMVYVRSGFTSTTNFEEMKAMYWANTSPADWVSAPDSQALLALFIEHAEQLSAEVDAGKFVDVAYLERTSGTGVHMQTVAEALHYNNTHEALHRGAILALKDFVTR